MYLFGKYVRVLIGKYIRVPLYNSQIHPGQITLRYRLCLVLPNQPYCLSL